MSEQQRLSGFDRGRQHGKLISYRDWRFRTVLSTVQIIARPASSTYHKRMKKKSSLSAAQSANRTGRQQSIVEEAAALFAEHGYQSASMDQLSARTGLNKGTVYYYYKSKAEILHAMCVPVGDECIARLLPALKMAHASDALEHLVSTLVRANLDHRDAVRVYFQELPHFQQIFNKKQYGKIREQQRTFMRIIYTVLDKGRKSGEFRDFDVKVDGRLIVGMIAWLYLWPAKQIDGEVIIRNLQMLILRGLQSPAN